MDIAFGIESLSKFLIDLPVSKQSIKEISFNLALIKFAASKKILCLSDKMDKRGDHRKLRDRIIKNAFERGVSTQLFIESLCQP